MGFHPKNTVHKMGRPKNIGVHSTGYSLKIVINILLIAVNIERK
jgi:hypothetical protein